MCCNTSLLGRCTASRVLREAAARQMRAVHGAVCPPGSVRQARVVTCRAPGTPAQTPRAQPPCACAQLFDAKGMAGNIIHATTTLFVFVPMPIKTVDPILPRAQLFDAKGMAGNIIHAIATTNAIISGLIVIEAIKVLAGGWGGGVRCVHLRGVCPGASCCSRRWSRGCQKDAHTLRPSGLSCSSPPPTPHPPTNTNTRTTYARRLPARAALHLPQRGRLLQAPARAPQAGAAQARLRRVLLCHAHAEGRHEHTHAGGPGPEGALDACCVCACVRGVPVVPWAGRPCLRA